MWSENFILFAFGSWKLKQTIVKEVSFFIPTILFHQSSFSLGYNSFFRLWRIVKNCNLSFLSSSYTQDDLIEEIFPTSHWIIFQQVYNLYLSTIIADSVPESRDPDYRKHIQFVQKKMCKKTLCHCHTRPFAQNDVFKSCRFQFSNSSFIET